MTLAEHVERYVTFRRALGHAYVEPARCLHDYAAYAETRGESFVPPQHGPRLGIDNAISPTGASQSCATCATLPASCTPTTNVTRCPTATPWAGHDHGGHRLIYCR